MVKRKGGLSSEIRSRRGDDHAGGETGSPRKRSPQAAWGVGRKLAGAAVGTRLRADGPDGRTSAPGLRRRTPRDSPAVRGGGRGPPETEAWWRGRFSGTNIWSGRVSSDFADCACDLSSCGENLSPPVFAAISVDFDVKVTPLCRGRATAELCGSHGRTHNLRNAASRWHCGGHPRPGQV